MKNIIIGLTITATILAGCNSNSNKSTESNTTLPASSVAEVKNNVSIEEIVNTYLQLKNSLAKDKTTDAAKAGTQLETAFENFDKTALAGAERKTFEDVEEDARENAEHIGENSGNIAHQREHFELLSKDIYDLVKAFGSGRVLYKFVCQSYNNGKGAFWISETNEIINPYFGETLPACGTIAEEI